MGWCHEFGCQIAAECNHPMVAAADSCTCVSCGTICGGRFGGCQTVWDRGPVPVAVLQVPQLRSRSARAAATTEPAPPPPRPTPAPLTNGNRSSPAPHPEPDLHGPALEEVVLGLQALTLRLGTVSERLLEPPAPSEVVVPEGLLGEIVSRITTEVVAAMAKAISDELGASMAHALSDSMVMGMVQGVKTELMAGVTHALEVHRQAMSLQLEEAVTILRQTAAQTAVQKAEHTEPAWVEKVDRSLRSLADRQGRWNQRHREP